MTGRDEAPAAATPPPVTLPGRRDEPDVAASHEAAPIEPDVAASHESVSMATTAHTAAGPASTAAAAVIAAVPGAMRADPPNATASNWAAHGRPDSGWAAPSARPAPAGPAPRTLTASAGSRAMAPPPAAPPAPSPPSLRIGRIDVTVLAEGPRAAHRADAGGLDPHFLSRHYLRRT
ncbi:hypothetical protein [Ideonella sp.]|uniref:hypothetical protein n=1 Tax=Ideonella sp. TaxID=1929293 RepID=UPI002E315382|nr:hypothetical protein [Ideonella sp.]